MSRNALINDVFEMLFHLIYYKVEYEKILYKKFNQSAKKFAVIALGNAQ